MASTMTRSGLCHSRPGLLAKVTWLWPGRHNQMERPAGLRWDATPHRPSSSGRHPRSSDPGHPGEAQRKSKAALEVDVVLPLESWGADYRDGRSLKTTIPTTAPSRKSPIPTQRRPENATVSISDAPRRAQPSPVMISAKPSPLSYPLG